MYCRILYLTCMFFLIFLNLSYYKSISLYNIFWRKQIITSEYNIEINIKLNITKIIFFIFLYDTRQKWQNNNMCAITNSKNGEQQEVISILLYEFLLFIFILFYIFFMFKNQYQNSAELFVTKTKISIMCATSKQVRNWHNNSLI